MARARRGTFEWTGDWSDSSPLWQQYPKVARAVEHTGSVDDGTFWMEWKDCQAYFKNLDFCSMWVQCRHHMPFHAMRCDAKQSAACHQLG